MNGKESRVMFDIGVFHIFPKFQNYAWTHEIFVVFTTQVCRL